MPTFTESRNDNIDAFKFLSNHTYGDNQSDDKDGPESQDVIQLENKLRSPRNESGE